MQERLFGQAFPLRTPTFFVWVAFVALAVIVSACEQPLTSAPNQTDEAASANSDAATQQAGTLRLQSFSGAGADGRDMLRGQFLKMEVDMPGASSRTIISTQVDGERKVFYGGDWSDLLTDDLRIRPELLGGSPTGEP